jgi:hypothetical protein
MKWFSIIGLLVSFFMASGAQAEGAENAVVGAGVGKCSEWTQTRERKNDMVDRILATWVQGYLSGINTYRYLTTNRPMVAVPSYQELLDRIDRDCRENPEGETFISVMLLYKSLLPEDSPERREEQAGPHSDIE